jgi:D-alanyl-lipoteichoic acid acyltransferase DltB (MBOAT superfamily)
MLFNSIDFAVFLPIVFFLYWSLANKDLKIQNGLIIAASYLFYGWWEWRSLFLILFSTLVDYLVGIALSDQSDRLKRKMLLCTSIGVNLGLLFYFKYYNFFIENFAAAFSIFGKEIRVDSLQVILPVGISFYTFQTMSYSIDVYRRSVLPTKDFIAFSAYVSFFPQLVAGPIERASQLLPQFLTGRTFDRSKAVDGLRQILWGLFKKMVIADNCATFADVIFSDASHHSGSTLVLGALFFTFQIYGDFSGYSDIAIGTARLFGFDLMQNFNFPYFSRDIGEFWRRWHISLSTWFRDYLYIPLGGSRGTTWMKVRNVFIIFIVSGSWHGANWTFIAWGLLNAIYFLPLLFTKTARNHEDVVAKGRSLPSLKELLMMTITFSMVVLGWIFFRAESMEHAINYVSGIFSPSLFSTPSFSGIQRAWTTVLLIAVFVMVEWQGREGPHALSELGLHWMRPLRYGLYYAIILAIFWFGGEPQTFIYFQF